MQYHHGPAEGAAAAHRPALLSVQGSNATGPDASAGPGGAAEGGAAEGGAAAADAPPRRLLRSHLCLRLLLRLPAARSGPRGGAQGTTRRQEDPKKTKIKSIEKSFPDFAVSFPTMQLCDGTAPPSLLPLPSGSDSPGEPHQVPHPAGAEAAGAPVPLLRQGRLQQQGGQSGGGAEPLPP